MLYIRAAEGEYEKGRVGDERGGKRKQENRTQNSICSGLDGSFFSLERAALNPICASCQLCPRVPWGGRKSGKWLISFTVGQVRARLTCAGMGFVWLRKGQGWMCNIVAMTKALKLNWIPICCFQFSCLLFLSSLSPTRMGKKEREVGVQKKNLDTN